MNQTINNYDQTSHPPSTLLSTLRALVPQRRLGYREALRITELQANRFRELLALNEPGLAEASIADLPRLSVKRQYGLPVSGLTHWHNGRWIIVLNADEPEGRVRFSLSHELHHVISHTTRQWTCWDQPGLSGASKSERLADYFAGCLLMPKRHVKSAFGQEQDQRVLAETFGVSVRAMNVRLSQLGLIGPTPRCSRVMPAWDHFGSPYFRQKSKPMPVGVAA